MASIHPLSVQEEAALGATHRGVILWSDFTTAGNTQSFNVAVLAAKMGLALVGARLVTPFVSSDGTLISLAVTGGDSGSANRFLTSMELNAAGSFVTLKGGVALNPSPFVYTAADNFIAAFTATAAKLLTTLTAGEIHFWFKIIDAR